MSGLYYLVETMDLLINQADYDKCGPMRNKAAPSFVVLANGRAVCGMWGIEDSRYSRQQKIDYAVRITRMYLRRLWRSLRYAD